MIKEEGKFILFKISHIYNIKQILSINICNIIKDLRIAATYMSRLEVKNDSYAIATSMREQPSIAKYKEGFIIAY